MRCPRCNRLTVVGLTSCVRCGNEFSGFAFSNISKGVTKEANRATVSSNRISLKGEIVKSKCSTRVSVRKPRLNRDWLSVGNENIATSAELRFKELQQTNSSSLDLPLRAGSKRGRSSLVFLPFKSESSGVKSRANRESGAVGFEVEGLQLLRLRCVAGLVDAGLLLGINVAVIYFTLRLSSLPIVSVGDLPIIPLSVFLIVFNVGYLSLLTACGGQTIGKMATGLRVESGQGSPVALGLALSRSVAYSLSMLLGGIGFLLVFTRSKRTFHDLLAGTRVVKA